MVKAGLNGTERRAAARYALPGRARVFWAGGRTEPVSISDMSAGGCQVAGDALPTEGTRVFLSIELAGLPNVRLQATVVRHDEREERRVCGLRFDVPRARLQGLARLLAHQARESAPSLLALVVDDDPRSLESVAIAVQRTGAQVIGVGSALDAVKAAETQHVDVVLARSNAEGLSALSAIAHASSETLRVAYGRGAGTTAAVAMGVAEATADDPCSAKCLSALMQRRSRPPL